MSEFGRELGARLRAVRHRAGLSLEAVQACSGGRLQAGTVGSWERGARAITVERLAELAAFYGVPVAELAARGEGIPASEIAAKETTT